MCVVDPMHNLLLGTAKHVTEIWKERSILTSKDFLLIQEKVNGCRSYSSVFLSKFRLDCLVSQPTSGKTGLFCTHCSVSKTSYHGVIINVGTILSKFVSSSVIGRLVKSS